MTKIPEILPGGTMPSSDAIRVAIVAYDGVSLLDLSGPLESFRVASTHPNHIGASLIYACSVHSARGGPIATADGVPIVTEPLTALYGQAIETLIGPGAGNIDDGRRDSELIDWIGRRAPDCRRICSVCIGAFLLAEAKLLTGKRVVTHWQHCRRLAKAIQISPWNLTPFMFAMERSG